MKQWVTLGAITLVLGYHLSYANDIVSAQDKTQIERHLLTGVPIVNIAAPNRSGVSHNTYQHFNIPDRAILNNSQQPIVTSAGEIAGNPHLTDQVAKLIVNEVIHPNPSLLQGPLEVAGTAANVIVANPWGMTCNGCSFSNIPHIFLTTGRAQFNELGDLIAYRVEKGAITIDGKGLDGKSTDLVSIMTRALIVNANLHAKELQIFLGTNHLDIATGKVKEITTRNQDKPRYALDASTIGGMYADKIKLVGTEAGVGINYEGVLQASEQIVMSSAGDVYFKPLSKVETNSFVISLLPKSFFAPNGTMTVPNLYWEVSSVVMNGRTKINSDNWIVKASNIHIFSVPLKLGLYTHITTSHFYMTREIHAAGEVHFDISKEYLQPGQQELGYTQLSSQLTAKKVTINAPDLEVEVIEGGIEAEVLNIHANKFRVGGGPDMPDRRIATLDAEQLQLNAKAIHNHYRIQTGTHAEIYTDRLLMTEEGEIRGQGTLHLHVKEGYDNSQNHITANPLTIDQKSY